MSLAELAESSSGQTARWLLDTPIPQLLAELDAELRLLPIGDERMWGRVDVREGRISMDLSSFLPAPLREQMVRVMLGQVLRVPLPDLPEPYRLTAL